MQILDQDTFKLEVIEDQNSCENIVFPAAGYYERDFPNGEVTTMILDGVSNNKCEYSFSLGGYD